MDLGPTCHVEFVIFRPKTHRDIWCEYHYRHLKCLPFILLKLRLNIWNDSDDIIVKLCTYLILGLSN